MWLVAECDGGQYGQNVLALRLAKEGRFARSSKGIATTAMPGGRACVVRVAAVGRDAVLHWSSVAFKQSRVLREPVLSPRNAATAAS